MDVIALGVLGITAGVLVLIGTMASSLRQARSTPQVMPPAVVQAVLALRDHKATPDQLRKAAVMASKAGALKLGALLQEEAAVASSAQEFAKLQPQPVSAPPRKSPLPGVSDFDWQQFVKRSSIATPSTVSPNYRLGMYELTARELSDIRWMTDAYKGPYQGRVVWLGTWADGKTLERFLASTDLQYDALVALTKFHARAIEARHGEVLSKREIEGQPATLSGLLAVARKAGLGGLKSWLENEKEREEFPETTARFTRFNGLF